MSHRDFMIPELMEPLFRRGRQGPSSREILRDWPSYEALRALGRGWEARFLQSRYRRAVGFITHEAIREGRLVRPDTCEECGEEDDIEAHHVNYDKPLEVEWLCHPCHVTADVQRRRDRPRAERRLSAFDPGLSEKLDRWRERYMHPEAA